jgi:hypothetical protein
MNLNKYYSFNCYELIEEFANLIDNYNVLISFLYMQYVLNIDLYDFITLL